MGAACSHSPPPLVEVHGPRNKVLVPAGTSFTVNPPSYRFPAFLRGRQYQRTPVYQRVRSPSSEESRDYRPRGRPRDRRRRRPLSEDTMSEMSFPDTSPGPRRAKMRGGGRGYGSGGGGGMGMPMGMGGRRMRPGPAPMGGYMDPADVRARSAPDLNMGYPPRPSPRPGMRGVSPGMPRGMSPGGTGYGAGMGDPGGPGGPGGPNPYAYPQGRAGTPYQGRAQTPLGVQPQPRKPMRPPGLNEVPMGAYGAGSPHPPVRANTEPSAAKRLNRTQPANREVGPSGQEWIKGDPFLDACICKTSCTCRQGQRVLYRSQAQDGEGHNGYGEIRYILKDDLGKDCGDHSKCKKSDEEEKKSAKKKGKGKQGGRDSDENLEFQDEMREHMAAMRKDLAKMKLKDKLGEASRMPFGNIPPGGMHPAMMEDPRMGPQFDANPYGMAGPHRPPPGMGGSMGGRPNRMGGMGMPGPMPGGMGYEDDPFSESGYGMGDMYDQMMEMGGRPPRGMRRRSGPPGFMGPPPRQGKGRPRRMPDMEMDMGGFGQGPPTGQRGMRSRGPRPEGRRRRPEFGPDEDFDMDMGMRNGGVGGRRGRDEYGDMEDDDEAAWGDEHDDDGGHGMRQSPSDRRNGGRQRIGRSGVRRDGSGGRQAHVEDDEEDL